MEITSHCLERYALSSDHVILAVFDCNGDLGCRFNSTAERQALAVGSICHKHMQVTFLPVFQIVMSYVVAYLTDLPQH